MKVKRNERIDRVPGTGFKIIQDGEKFSYGIDAILLSEFASKGRKLVDLGTGTAIIPIRILGRHGDKKIYGVEIQDDVADMARRSVELNGLEDNISIVNRDLKEVEDIFDRASMDTVVSNPPYMSLGGGIINEDDNKAISRHELRCDIEDVIQASDYLLKTLGRFYMVHRPDRLVDIFYYMRKYRIEPKRICFIKPDRVSPANLLLIEGRKHGNPELRIEKEIIVYDGEGNYTEEIGEIYYGSRRNG